MLSNVRQGPAPAAASAVALGTVLLVDDEQAIRKLVARILDRSGYTVLQAEDGDDALRVAGDHGGPIDVVLTDLVMPGMGGVEVAARLRLRWPSLRVVYMSGYGEEDLSAHGVHGAELFLSKPFRPEDVVTRVGEALC
jgi:CheY-like chemotaxis protein